MCYQAMKRGTFNAYYQMKEANLKKPTYCMMAIIWLSGKDKIMELVKNIGG